jgi:hypothetical protein
MKVKKKIVEELVKGLKNECQAYFNTGFDQYIKTMLKATTVEEVMYVKKQIILHILNSLPMYDESCYFCIETDMNCGICSYAKIHKSCTNNQNSDWVRIQNAIEKLENLIDHTYCEYGEIYSEEEEE